MDDFRWRELRVKLTQVLVGAAASYVVGSVDQIFAWLDGIAADAVAAHAAGRGDLCEQVSVGSCNPSRMAQLSWRAFSDSPRHAQNAIGAALSSVSATVACSRQLKPMSAVDAITLTSNTSTEVADELLAQAIREEEELKDPLLERWQDAEERRT